MVEVDDIQAVYGEQEPALSTDKKQELADMAGRIRTTVFGGRVTRQSELEGNPDDFEAYLGAHLWEIAEGGEAQSQSQTGGSVNFQHLQTNVESTLSETRYGRVCLMMLRSNASIGIVRADY
ncbi:hypothetical protein [Halorarum salinum]|uniref:Uncharacterized protein n=1 Tax=Halorarum salinum TaxID=2743089 RepID=A0A7D5LBU4_9EURY|nr:hypothetical protein [Halobaculum salinum]QLG62828.1 hypothetical protein HUG12_14265 [Halobaculum salinum]